MEVKATNKRTIFRPYSWFYILSFLTLLLSIGWLYYTREWEPTIAVVTSTASLIAIYWNDEDKRSNSDENNRTRIEARSNALTRIQRERNNFERLQQPIKYTGESHRKAVEVYSFELLEKDLVNLNDYCSFRRLTNKVVAESARLRNSAKKDVSVLIPLLDKLEAKLKKASASS